ncbi:hypothetical protein QQS21_002333 [Conoideocrella luteorostrata]|uniref:Peptidase M3A/M3B catalytic domain-containing protein n=1 Tax=Conoideocrella luteorostrata TaxID=1105319 RepID=A0AAJ0CVH0_9HYPO|nr:hypothetical protein QQS21_002333 [Conoideocrella luteorostrata]
MSLKTTPTPPQLPVIFDATPETLLSDAAHAVNATTALYDAILADVSVENATFANVILPIFLHENVWFNKTRAMRLYASTAPSKAVREASYRATTMLDIADVELYSRVDIFQLVKAAGNAVDNDAVALDAQSQHYLAKLIRKFIDNGCDIPDQSVRCQFSSHVRKLGEVNRRIAQNLDREATGVWFTEAELEGVPNMLMSRFKGGNTAEHEGSYWVSTKTPFSTPVLRHARLEETRKRMFYAVKNRIPENVDLFRQLVLLRDDISRMLGYAHHLARTTSRKVAQTPEFVTSLLCQLKERLSSAAIENARDLLQLKAKDIRDGGSSGDGSKLYVWDQEYYARKQIDAVKPDESRTSQYFELFTTFGTILEIFGRLLDTRFDRITAEQQRHLGAGKPLVWHEDMLMYSVWDTRQDDTFLGYAYFDFFSRDGKYTHNGHYAIQWGFDNVDGTKYYPSSALVMNFSKTTTQPTLLNMNELRRLFHQLGHLYHNLLTNAKYAYLHYIDRDFVEVPSLMFEEFLYLEGPIKELSCHYSHISPQMRDVWRADCAPNEEQPSKKLTDAEAAALAGGDKRSNIRKELASLFFASYDVLVHAPDSHQALVDMNLAEEFNRLQSAIRALHGGEACGDGWEWSHGEAVFRAIASGYSGGYYAYIIGRAWGLDMFHNCFKADINNREAARRYRDVVLARGGTQPELRTFQEFVGRGPDLEAYFSWLGV